MTTLVLRGTNPDPSFRLTSDQMDQNFINLDTDKMPVDGVVDAVRETVLTGLIPVASANIVPEDKPLRVIGKLQAQIDGIGGSGSAAIGAVPIGFLVGLKKGLANIVSAFGATYLKSGVVSASEVFPDAPRTGQAGNVTVTPMPGDPAQKWGCLIHAGDKGILLAVPYIRGDTYVTSNDGVNWVERKLPVSGRWVTGTYGLGLFVIVSDDSSVSLSSSDGINWTQNVFPFSNARSIAFNGSRFLVINNSAQYAFSTNGTVWTLRSLPQAGNWKRILYAGSRFVIVGEQESVTLTSTSPTGPWTVGTIESGASGHALAYLNGIWVTAGANGNLAATSADGITWVTRTLPATGDWQGMAVTTDRFCLFDIASSTYLTSIDGVDWGVQSLNSGIGGKVALTIGNIIYTPSMGVLGVMTAVTPGTQTVDNAVALFADPDTQLFPLYMRVA